MLSEAATIEPDDKVFTVKVLMSQVIRPSRIISERGNQSNAIKTVVFR
jgi:hypothetical protein